MGSLQSTINSFNLRSQNKESLLSVISLVKVKNKKLLKDLPDPTYATPLTTVSGP